MEIVQKVYIGPTIPKTPMRESRVLWGSEDEIREYIKPLMENYPEVQHLLVEPGKLCEAKREARTPGRLLCKYYNDLRAKAAGFNVTAKAIRRR